MRVGEAHWHPHLVPYKEVHEHFEHNDYPTIRVQEELKLLFNWGFQP